MQEEVMLALGLGGGGNEVDSVEQWGRGGTPRGTMAQAKAGRQTMWNRGEVCALLGEVGRQPKVHAGCLWNWRLAWLWNLPEFQIMLKV